MGYTRTFGRFEGADFKIVMGDRPETECWGRKKTVIGVPSAWASLFSLDDGTVLGCAATICHSISFS